MYLLLHVPSRCDMLCITYNFMCLVFVAHYLFMHEMIAQNPMPHIPSRPQASSGPLFHASGIPMISCVSPILLILSLCIKIYITCDCVLF
jgi:hypothetical protein